VTVQAPPRTRSPEPVAFAKYWAHVLTEIKNRGVGDVCIVVCDGLKWTSPKTVKACTMRCLSICQDAVAAPSEGVRAVRFSSASMMRQRCVARCRLSARVAYRGDLPWAIFLS
jgi:hypothetical protein